MEDLAARIDPPDLDVAVEDILVLQNAGTISPLGMPEAGYLPIPKKLAKAGVNDIVRISDARMFGTAFGTIILQVTLGTELGGPWRWSKMEIVFVSRLLPKRSIFRLLLRN